jgi:hypothetical protein
VWKSTAPATQSTATDYFLPRDLIVANLASSASGFFQICQRSQVLSFLTKIDWASDLTPHFSSDRIAFGGDAWDRFASLHLCATNQRNLAGAPELPIRSSLFLTPGRSKALVALQRERAMVPGEA